MLDSEANGSTARSVTFVQTFPLAILRMGTEGMKAFA